MRLIKGNKYKILYEDLNGLSLFNGYLIAKNAGYRKNTFIFHNKKSNKKLIVNKRDIIKTESDEGSNI